MSKNVDGKKEEQKEEVNKSHTSTVTTKTMTIEQEPVQQESNNSQESFLTDNDLMRNANQRKQTKQTKPKTEEQTDPWKNFNRNSSTSTIIRNFTEAERIKEDITKNKKILIVLHYTWGDRDNRGWLRASENDVKKLMLRIDEVGKIIDRQSSDAFKANDFKTAKTFQTASNEIAKIFYDHLLQKDRFRKDDGNLKELNSHILGKDWTKVYFPEKLKSKDAIMRDKLWTVDIKTLVETMEAALKTPNQSSSRGK